MKCFRGVTHVVARVRSFDEPAFRPPKSCVISALAGPRTQPLSAQAGAGAVIKIYMFISIRFNTQKWNNLWTLVSRKLENSFCDTNLFRRPRRSLEGSLKILECLFQQCGGRPSGHDVQGENCDMAAWGFACCSVRDINR